MENREIVYSYYQIPAETEDAGHNVIRGTGYICVALLRPAKGSDDSTYKAAFSFASPADKLNKKFGRKIASGRLACIDRPGRNISFSFEKGKIDFRLHQVFDEALNRAVSTEGMKVPRWLTSAVVENKPLPVKQPQPLPMTKMSAAKV